MSKLNGALGLSVANIAMNRDRICALGVTLENGVFELYGANLNNEALLQGWFFSEACYALITDRPSCYIASEEGALPAEFITLLESIGHSVVIIPAPIVTTKPRRKMRAKELCGMAMGWMSAGDAQRGNERKAAHN